MVWNHRIVKRVYHHASGDETTYQIHEVYYDEIGSEPTNITLDPIAPLGETVEELKEELNRMLRALEHPVLNYEDF